MDIDTAGESEGPHQTVREPCRRRAEKGSQTKVVVCSLSAFPDEGMATSSTSRAHATAGSGSRCDASSSYTVTAAGGRAVQPERHESLDASVPLTRLAHELIARPGRRSATRAGQTVQHLSTALQRDRPRSHLGSRREAHGG